MKKTRESELVEAIEKARDELSKIRSAAHAKQNMELIGRCFKYRNSYSLPEGPGDYWWMFCKVTGVEGDALLILEFQTDKYGETSIKKDSRNLGLEMSHLSESSNYIPIGNDEFQAEWDSLIGRLQGIKI